MFFTLLSSFTIAQYIAPRVVKRNALTRQGNFHVDVGNPTKQTGTFYIDPVSLNADGTPSFQIEQGVHLSARKVSLRSGGIRQVNGTAEIDLVSRSFFICTSPVEPTILQQGNRERVALGIRARACSRVEIKKIR